MLRILNGGLQTTVQDLGRFGWYKIGMPPSGAMDIFSFRVGNLLVGNHEKRAGLETTFTGPEIETSEEALIAVVGAPISLRINGSPARMWMAHRLARGDRISCGDVQDGVRSYLCISGGIDIPELLGSRSTYMLGRFGGLEGRRLQAGDALAVGRPDRDLDALAGRRIEPGLAAHSLGAGELHVIMGLCSYRLTAESRSEFLGSEWEVSNEADRVGYRFKGPTFKFVEREQPFGAGSNPSNVVDLGYPIGSIQVPGGLEAIMLMRDAVTGGGYATICTVIQADIDRVAQLPPGTKVRFREVDIDEALLIRREYWARLQRIAHSLGLFDSHGLLGQ